MTVNAILEVKGRKVETVPPDASVVLVVHKLASLGIGALVVVDGDQVKGTISERDIVKALGRLGADVLEKSVRDVMSADPPVCSPGDPLVHVMAVMTRSRHRHLPVVTADGRLCGVVSIGDVIKHRLDEMELQAAVLRDAYRARH